MKKYFGMLVLCCLGAVSLQAQVGMTSNNPNKNAVLDLNKTDGTNTKGLLLPKVALTAINSALPMSAHVAGMKVYNTATAGTGINAVMPGEYCNDGTQWVRTASTAWTPEGNAGTTTANFVGTTDAVDFVARTNNVERMRVTSTGQVLVGTTTAPTGGTTSKMVIDNGTTAGAVQIKDGTEGTDKFLVSDANGVGTWQTVSPISNATGRWWINGTNTFVVAPTGTVETGTTSIDVGNNITGLTAVTNGVKVPEGTYMVYMSHDIMGWEYGQIQVLTNTGVSVFSAFYGGWFGGEGFYLKVPVGGLTLQCKFSPNPAVNTPNKSQYNLYDTYTAAYWATLLFLKIN